jgi:hypothetical protein
VLLCRTKMHTLYRQWSKFSCSLGSGAKPHENKNLGQICDNCPNFPHTISAPAHKNWGCLCMYLHVLLVFLRLLPQLSFFKWYPGMFSSIWRFYYSLYISGEDRPCSMFWSYSCRDSSWPKKQNLSWGRCGCFLLPLLEDKIEACSWQDFNHDRWLPL